jgi:hypothetical protein
MRQQQEEADIISIVSKTKYNYVYKENKVY